MGAKTPEPMTLRRQSCVCDICDRQFMTASALISHKKFRHTNLAQAAKRASLGASNLKAGKKGRSMSPDTKKSANMTPTRSATPKPATKVRKESTVKKIEFKCPKCVKIFSVYFSAYRHIQKHHCVDENDEPVDSNSTALIKPIRVELCQTCNEWIKPSESHTCEKVAKVMSENYTCIGCHEAFNSLQLFEAHVKDLHAKNAERLFFPTSLEFTSWRKELEETLRVKFNTIISNDNSRHVYHCSPPTLDVESKTPLCPATLYVTEFKSGYQVLYYKEHYGHSVSELPLQKYKKYSLQNFVTDCNTEDSVYSLFKSVMQGVITNAVSVDITVLNTLLGKAYEMTHVLNNIGEQTEALVAKKKMSDDQITEVLAEVRTYTNKRKAEATKETKRVKISEENDENSNKQTELLLPAGPRAVLMTPPLSSFNDSYKDFIESTLPNSNSSTPKQTPKPKKVIVKTKIGQFKTRASLSPKAPKIDKDIDESTEASKETPKNTKNDTKEISKTKNVSKETPKSIENVSKTIKSVSKEVVKVKPKMRPSFASKLKPDFEYVVKERENDCNILILKI